jgi:dipeptidase E
MKLYLSSYRLGNEPQKLAEMVGKNRKTAIISNALDCYTDLPRRKATIEREMTDLKSIGLIPFELDLRNYFGKPEELAKKMFEFGSVWVLGGNTFILRRAFAESGFDKWLIGRKNDKEFVYAGYSAGVCVLSPSLKGSDITDDPNATAVGYKPEIIWDGLNLINFAFCPHFESNHPESESIGREVIFYKKNNIPFKSLHDGEVIISEI